MNSERTHDLHGFSYDERQSLLPDLTQAFTQSGGWLLERKAISARTMQFRLEIQLHAIVELYAALVGTGIELTRGTHTLLTELCTRDRYAAGRRQPSEVIGLNLELSFLEEITLHSLLSVGAWTA